MQSPTRPSDRQAAIFVSVAVGIVVAVITTATFWWIYSLTLGPEKVAEAAAAANAPRWSPSDGAKVITAAQPNTPTDGRQPWLGQQAWTDGVQAGQAWITSIPNPANAQVLTGLTSAEVWTYMVQYVSGGLGVSCQYCHDINNFAADTFPQKVAARAMMKMVSDLNGKFVTQVPNWRGNFVQCATCHNSAPQNLEAVAPQFIKGVPPIPVTVDPLDETGAAIIDPAKKPAAIQGQVSLQDAVIFYIYNYQVWKPFDPAVADSGRGSLALTYEGGRTQDQVTINQNVMNNNAWALGVGCNFCHNSRNFVAYELDAAGNVNNSVYGYNKLKAQQMLLMTTYMAQNWTTFGAIAKTAVPTALEGGASKFSYQTLNGQIYNMPGCYTCHRGVNVPLGSLDGTTIPAGAAGNVFLPPALRGTN